MDRDRDQLRQEIEEKKASMAAKLEAIGERVEGMRHRLEHARESISIHAQVEQRPWTMMGLSVLAGYLLYRVTHLRPLERVEHARVARPARAEAARAGAIQVREGARGRDYSMVRSAAGTLGRALLSNVAGMLAGVIATRIKDAVHERRMLGSAPAAGAYEHTMQVRPPEAATGTGYPLHPGIFGTGR